MNIEDQHNGSLSSTIQRDAAFLILFTFGYLVIVHLELKFATTPEGVASVWPASGYALAALLLAPKRLRLKYFAAIFVANAAGNLYGGNSVVMSVGFAAANTLETFLCSSAMIFLAGEEIAFTRVKDVLALIASAFAINGITASIGAFVPHLALGAPYLKTWLVWWAADGLGIMVVTPLIVSWMHRPREAANRGIFRYIEAFVLIVFFFFTSLFLLSAGTVSDHYFLYTYFVFPFFIWAAMRFGIRGNTTLLAAFAASLIIVVLSHKGVSESELLRQRDVLLNNQMYLAVVAVTSLMLMAAMLERKTTQSRLFESERKLRLIASNIKEAVFAYDIRGKSMYMNPSAEALSGYRTTEFNGMKLADMVHDDDRERVRDIWESAYKGASFHNEEFRLITKDGKIKWVSGAWNPMLDEKGRQVGVEGTMIDITRRKEAEEKAQASEAKYRTILESAMDGFWLVDNEGKIIEVNAAQCVMIGYERDEIVGNTVAMFEYIDDIGMVRARIEKMKRTGFDHFESIYKHKNGALINVEVNIKHLKALDAFSVFAHDITKKKRNEIILQEAEREKSLIVNSVPDMIFYIDSERKVAWANDTAGRVMNQCAEDFKGMTCGRICECLGIPHEHCFVDDAFSKRTAIKGEIETKTSVWSVAVYPTLDTSGSVKAAVYVLTDVTARKEFEDERLKSQKLESLGVLAGGIAHDFNNILTGLWGNIQLVAMNLENTSDEESIALIKESERACKRAKDLTQQLLTFARGGEPIKKPMSVGPVLWESASFALRGTNVKSDFDLERGLWQIEADEGQMSQVFNNLAINASQAMPNGGTLTVVAKNFDATDRELASKLNLAVGKYIQITITDQGIGISKEYIGKIFDPYFTTKKKGSGLGLTTCYSIVKKHGGRIAVESQPGVGTTFDIYLPTSGSIPELPKREARSLRTGTGRILVMDDEDAVSGLAKKLLEKLGYEVVIADSGEVAIELYRNAMEFKNPFRAVILDLTIPGGMGGMECVKKLIEIDPDVKAIVTSGYSNDPVMSNYREHGFRGIIVKPYTLDEMSKVVAEV